jgi:alanyl-tRNA synthetase
MTSAEIRQSFLDFFASKQHTVVRSSSLMPDSPNLLFTNAGMNQFVPIFLGQQKCPYTPGRAADTQKCIRAGGKHNDLEDVGLDTYHHTFFEMLGNWSFGDYFKREAIEWAWELVTGVWQFPMNRLYATVYSPNREQGDPSDFDQEAHDHWARWFSAAGLDPRVHIVHGGKKDNFWMMGETGPCGPCSELHVDLTPAGDTRGALVNRGSAQCIEIWNLVFIQFNANPDGTFSPLPAQHVDTGMGFERVTGIIQNTRGFTDFSRVISNYETDVFRPIFDRLEKLSGRRYGSTLPRPDATGNLVPTTDQEKVDVAFRVIADHIRTLSFAIADGIQPGNTDRHYVLRRILRRAVRYGRTLGFHGPFFHQLAEVLAETMGGVFPEIQARREQVKEVIRVEEEAFNKTLDRGMDLFEDGVTQAKAVKERILETNKNLAAMLEKARHIPDTREGGAARVKDILNEFKEYQREWFNDTETLPPRSLEVQEPGENPILVLARELVSALSPTRKLIEELVDKTLTDASWYHKREELPGSILAAQTTMGQIEAQYASLRGAFAFKLYDTYGFPLDLTQLMAREAGLSVDVEGFNRLMEEQRERARKSQKKTVIELSQVETSTPTQFVGFEALVTRTEVLEVVALKGKTAVILDASPCYAEMGGQVGDQGELSGGGQLWRVINTQKAGNVWLHFLADEDAPTVGQEVSVAVDPLRRAAIQRHHTVTHLLHWALHEVVGREASQKGSYVGPEKLTFDFNSAALTSEQVRDIERLVNERVLENAPVSWVEVKYNHVKDRPEIMQFFGDKYGEWVRVVQIGGEATALNGYSMELCGGTHTRATGEIGLFRVVAESAIAAGVRRIEAVSGLEAYRRAQEEQSLIRALAGRVNSPVGELERKIENLVGQQKEMEKQLRALAQKQAAEQARQLIARARELPATASRPAVKAIIEHCGAADGDTLQAMANELKGQFQGIVVLAGVLNGAVSLVSAVSPEFAGKVHAGKILQAIAPIVGGKGGGKPDNARGGGKDATKVEEALAEAARVI